MGERFSVAIITYFNWWPTIGRSHRSILAVSSAPSAAPASHYRNESLYVLCDDCDISPVRAICAGLSG